MPRTTSKFDKTLIAYVCPPLSHDKPERTHLKVDGTPKEGDRDWRVAAAKARSMTTRGLGQLRCYRCKVCALWHVGNVEPKPNGPLTLVDIDPSDPTLATPGVTAVASAPAGPVVVAPPAEPPPPPVEAVEDEHVSKKKTTPAGYMTIYGRLKRHKAQAKKGKAPALWLDVPAPRVREGKLILRPEHLALLTGAERERLFSRPVPASGGAPKGKATTAPAKTRQRAS